jgi:Raf kinase inhibitor-like YbhB/YbcL family protein
VRGRALGALLLVGLTSCLGGGGATKVPLPSASSTITVFSSAFQPGAPIPAAYTCDGPDISPALNWSAQSQPTEFVLVVTDVSAPGGQFVHWVVFGIPVSTSNFPQGGLPPGAQAGKNDFGEVDYGGPCPPKGDPPHQYEFTVYALNQAKSKDLHAGASAGDVLSTITCCVSAKGTLVGTYQRV